MGLALGGCGYLHYDLYARLLLTIEPKSRSQSSQAPWRFISISEIKDIKENILLYYNTKSSGEEGPRHANFKVG